MKISRHFRALLLLIFPFVITGCVEAASLAIDAAATQINKVTTKSKVDEKADTSTLETRAIQLKEIDAGYDMTFRAAMDVLQDMGFTISQTDMETGHLVGVKKIPITTTVGNVWSKQEMQTYIPQESTVTMEKWKKGSTRVRVVTDLGKSEGAAVNLSASDKEKYLQPDKFYEEFFARLNKAVFLRKEKI